MDLQPTVENKLLKVSPMENSDLEALYEVAKDPKVWKQHPIFETFTLGYARNNFGMSP